MTTDGPSDARRPPRSGRLRDVRVLELTHVLAGPIIGSLLGAMGAQVARFEELDRLDIYRRTGPFAEGTSGPERGAYFSVANHSKSSVAADAAEAPRLLAAMLAHSDVFIENVGRSRVERVGVDPVELAATGILGLSVSGFGSDGPMAEYRAYATNVQAYGGLAGLTIDHDRRTAKLGTVLADPLSSVVAATVIAAWAVGMARDQGALVDVAMAEVVASTIAEYVTAASLGEDVSPPVGNDLAPFAPHGVYLGADDRWLAIAVESDAEWEMLKAALGWPHELDRQEWADESCRSAERHSIDDALDLLVGKAEAGLLAEQLQASGVRAAIVLGGTDLVADEHLRARDFVPEIEHPDPELRRGRLVGLPWRFVDEGAVVLGPPPALGSTSATAWMGADADDR